MSITLEPAVVEDAEDLTRLQMRSFYADSTSILARLIWPPLATAEKEEKRAQKLIESMRESLQKDGGVEKVYMKALLDGHLVGFAAWRPPGKDKLDPVPLEEGKGVADKSGNCSSRTPFEERMGERIKQTRRERLKGERYWYLTMITVDPDHWRKGIGRRLVQWGTDQADQDAAGATSTFLEASLMGEAFYETLGFKTIGWDALDDERAPNGVCKWPYMKREAATAR